jgi:hypothetical protein
MIQHTIYQVGRLDPGASITTPPIDCRGQGVVLIEGNFGSEGYAAVEVLVNGEVAMVQPSIEKGPVRVRHLDLADEVRLRLVSLDHRTQGFFIYASVGDHAPAGG